MEPDRIASSSVVFYHASVGKNVLEGLVSARRAAGQEPLRIATPEGWDGVDRAVFLDVKSARNGKPMEKIGDLKSLGDRFAPGGPDLLLFKLCYADFRTGQDPEKVFAAYRQAVEDVERRFPGTKVVHITTPLVVHAGGIRQYLFGDKVNIAVNRYNDLLRGYCGAGRLLFDLALLESTAEDGSRATFEFKSRTYEQLFRPYTADGGHLNAKGQAWVGGRLNAFLEQAIRPGGR